MDIHTDISKTHISYLFNRTNMNIYLHQCIKPRSLFVYRAIKVSKTFDPGNCLLPKHHSKSSWNTLYQPLILFFFKQKSVKQNAINPQNIYKKGEDNLEALNLIIPLENQI